VERKTVEELSVSLTFGPWRSIAKMFGCDGARDGGRVIAIDLCQNSRADVGEDTTGDADGTERLPGCPKGGLTDRSGSPEELAESRLKAGNYHFRD
jgi:hypothetical protein